MGKRIARPVCVGLIHINNLRRPQDSGLGRIAEDATLRDVQPRYVSSGSLPLDDEAHRRAMAGSDALLMFLLRGRRPEVYARHDEPPVSRVNVTNVLTFEEAMKRIEDLGLEEPSFSALPLFVRSRWIENLSNCAAGRSRAFDLAFLGSRLD